MIEARREIDDFDRVAGAIGKAAAQDRGVFLVMLIHQQRVVELQADHAPSRGRPAPASASGRLGCSSAQQIGSLSKYG